MIGQEIAIIGELDGGNPKQACGQQLSADQGVVQSHPLTVDHCLHADIGVGDDQAVAGRAVGQVRRRVPVGPGVATVAVLKLWQGRQRRFQADLADPRI